MTAAAKMKKAQTAALSGRPYAEKIAEMVKELVKKIEPEKHALLKPNNSDKKLIILISTNKGLCGGLNTNLFRSLLRSFTPEDLDKSTFVTLGKKGEAFVVRQKKQLVADFSATTPFTVHIPALTTMATEGFLKAEYSEVYLYYNNFVTALRQEPTLKRILPVSDLPASQSKEEKAEDTGLDFTIEPSLDDILDPLLVSYLENQVRDAVLEAEASEHSARMLSMKNATDNAKELINILTLEYNKARQEKITYEISDMVTARLAVE